MTSLDEKHITTLLAGIDDKEEETDRGCAFERDGRA
jgi:hypothetical protein